MLHKQKLENLSKQTKNHSTNYYKINFTIQQMDFMYQNS